MKTILQIKTEIQTITSDIKELCQITDKSKITRLKKRIKWLKDCVLYLENDPDAEYLRQQLFMLTNKRRNVKDRVINSFTEGNKNFDLTSPESKKKITTAENQQGVKQMTEQIKFIQYLLN